ncbi:MAG: hypothetical protein JNM14_04140 [Ferruginibacter sp.]|nr:hypothetical protein [Ferruginibacter sp.]
MKKLYEIALLFSLCITLCSCPYSSAYYLDETSGIYVEDALLGKWIALVKKPNSSREAEVYVTLSKRTDTEYYITLTGDLNDLRPFNVLVADSLTGTAFMSIVDERQFLNIRINAKNYIAELKLKDDKLSLLPLSEGFTAKMIFNSSELRKSVEVHYKTRVHPLLDDDFCLRNMTKLN